MISGDGQSATLVPTISALTHVLVDDCTCGYGIFAENMLETAQSVGEGSPLPQSSEQLKDAS